MRLGEAGRRFFSQLRKEHGTLIDVADRRRTGLGEFLRSQRQLAGLSLRQLSDAARVSNPYLSQVERGIHEPSVRVLNSLAQALGIPPERLLAHAGMSPASSATPQTEAAIAADPLLDDAQKRALLAVYRSYIEPHPHA